jgi:ferritin-like metal-binding protein YciE
MSIDTLKDLFVHTLKDMHYAESKIHKSLPKMIEAADDAELKSALEAHLDETKGQIERLKQVFTLIGEKAGSEECDAINGILKEGDGALDDTDGTPMRDCAVIASGQAVEHYEIVRYRSLVMWAGALGFEEPAKLLQQSLDEERAADEKLMKFAAYCQGGGLDDKALDIKSAGAKAKSGSKSGKAAASRSAKAA